LFFILQNNYCRTYLSSSSYFSSFFTREAGRYEGRKVERKVGRKEGRKEGFSCIPNFTTTVYWYGGGS
jgi:hypothetical protein